jgi:hypothetical protein
MALISNVSRVFVVAPEQEVSRFNFQLHQIKSATDFNGDNPEDILGGYIRTASQPVTALVVLRTSSIEGMILNIEF